MSNIEEKFWNDIIQEKGEHPVIHGVCYHIADEFSRYPFRGNDGRMFHIKNLETGKITTTTNLWTNGKVPLEFREYLPDNAEFVWDQSK